MARQVVLAMARLLKNSLSFGPLEWFWADFKRLRTVLDILSLNGTLRP